MSKKVSYKKYIRVFKLYIVPIFAIIFFFLNVVLLVIPKISEILSNLELIEVQKSKFESINKELSDLIKISRETPEINTLLSKINQLAPSEVSDVIFFRDKVTDLARKNNLTIKIQRFTENRNQVNSQLQGITLQEIPTFFDIEGTYDNIIKFIEELSLINDFVIVKKMDLILRDVLNPDKKPNTSIEFTKYLFSENSEIRIVDNIYRSIPLSETIPFEVREYLKN